MAQIYLSPHCGTLAFFWLYYKRRTTLFILPSRLSYSSLHQLESISLKKVLWSKIECFGSASICWMRRIFCWFIFSKCSSCCSSLNKIQLKLSTRKEQKESTTNFNMKRNFKTFVFVHLYINAQLTDL